MSIADIAELTPFPQNDYPKLKYALLAGKLYLGFQNHVYALTGYATVLGGGILLQRE